VIAKLTLPGWTVATLQDAGIDAVEASCQKCEETWQAPISFLPPATTLEKVAALMACPTCGGRNIEVAPSRTARVLTH
jgi:hypothetical protein